MVEEDWEAPEINYLNSYDWIKEDDLYDTQNELDRAYLRVSLMPKLAAS